MQDIPRLRFEETLFSIRSSKKKYRWMIAALVSAYVVVVVVWSLVGSVPIFVVAEGVIAPQSDAQSLHAQIRGEVQSSVIKLGRQVSEGEVLVQLVTTQKELERATIIDKVNALKQVEEAYEERREQIKDDLVTVSQIEKKEVAAARKELRQKQSLARESRSRLAVVEALHEEGQASGYELDQARLTANSDRLLAAAWRERVAGASLPTEALRIVQREVTAIDERLIDIRSQIATLEADRKILDEDLTNYQIIAPVSGKIVRGEMLAEGVRVNAGDELALIEPETDLLIRGTVPAEKGGKVREGQRAKLELASFSQARFGFVQCEVASVVRSAEETKLDIEFRVLGQLPDYLGSGDRGSVHIQVERTSPFKLLLDQI